MNSQIRRETAQILQFPPSGLRARAHRFSQVNPKQMQDIASAAPLINTDAWYHQAAISESERPRKP